MKDETVLNNVDIKAVETLVSHQRLYIGKCLCGWGSDKSALGQLHSLHVWEELKKALIHVVIEETERGQRAMGTES